MKINKVLTNKMINTSINNDVTMYKKFNILDSLPVYEQENLLPFPYYTKSGTYFGINYNINDDGSITISGTANNISQFDFCVNDTLELESGDYILSGNTLVDDGVIVLITKSIGSTTVTLAQDDGDEDLNKFTINKKSKVGACIIVPTGSTVNGTIYPMLERGNIAHKYRRYSLSNYGLNDKIKSIESLVYDGPDIYNGTETPDDSLGKDGDIYIKTGMRENGIKSHIGMIIQSTTLDTEAKVKEIYGGESWTRLNDVMLVGAGNKYTVNSTGGSATNVIAIANLPAHTHTVGAHSHGLNSHTHSIPALSGTAYNTTSTWNSYSQNGVGNGTNTSITQNLTDNNYGNVGGHFYFWNSSYTNIHGHSVTTNASTTGASSGSTANSTAFNSGSTGSGTALNNMPPYKAVYIWERTA